jgi:hypothetical protein
MIIDITGVFLVNFLVSESYSKPPKMNKVNLISSLSELGITMKPGKETAVIFKSLSNFHPSPS